MKIYKNADNKLVCDTHASDELKQIRLPLSTLQVWELVRTYQKHFSEFCVECAGKK